MAAVFIREGASANRADSESVRQPRVGGAAARRQRARARRRSGTLRPSGAGASELAREARADAIVVYSGDGVFNEVLNGVTGDAPLGLVPGGHTNVLARALGLPEDPIAVAGRIAAALVEKRARRISLGRVNGRRFAFGAGIGIDAELVRRIEELGPRAKGKARGDLLFTWEGAKLLARRRGRFTEVLEIEGLGRAAFVLVSNGPPYTYAGPLPLRVHPEADFEHGLDLLAPRESRARTWPRYTTYVLRGRGQERAADILYGHDLDRIVVRCDAPLPLQADGEDRRRHRGRSRLAARSRCSSNRLPPRWRRCCRQNGDCGA